MAADSILQRLDAEFDNPPEQIRAVVALLEAGCSPLFLHLFRPDETGDPGEERIVAIDDRWRFLEELEARKSAQLELAAERGHDVEALRALLVDSVDQDLLDDVDHLLRPHEHKAMAQVEALGLSALVEQIHRHEVEGRTPQEIASDHLAPDHGLNAPDEVLAQIVLALAERYGEDPDLRAHVRAELSRGILQAKAASPEGGGSAKKGKAQHRYEQFFGLEEPVRKVPANRMLALRRAEREKVITLRLVLPHGRELELFRERFSPDVAHDTPLGQFLDLLYGHAYDQHVHRPCEQTVRHHLKERADRETVRAFGRAVRAQLMSPVLDDVPVAALRASQKSAWFVALAADGQIIAKETLPVPKEEPARNELKKALAESILKAEPDSIAIPHGRREEQANKLLREVLAEIEAGARPRVVAIDETASVVWATSPNARRRHAGTDTGLRATLSLARRLRDPLTELMRVEPRGLGLGQNLTEVHQGLLNRQLDSVLTSCLARIGVDANRADPALLARLPGVNRDLAKTIATHRSANGAFEAREDLQKVEGVDDVVFTSIAGFLRLRGGREPLDGTGVHPEDYPVVATIAGHLGTDQASLIGKRPLGISPQEVARVSGIEPRRARRVVMSLEAGLVDPRGRLAPFKNDGVTKFEDLKLDLQLRGRISNLTDFGAFVDLGVGQDGLVHVSQIPGSRLRDPDRMLRVGEVITVYVVHLDDNGRRISLSMSKPRHVAEGRPATLGERMAPGSGGREGRRRRRGHDEREEQVMNRAARVPEGRRGQRRGPKPKARPGNAGEGFGGGGFGGGRRGPRPQGKPRVITVESDRQTEEARGHKGELRSLSSLRGLLQPERPEPAETPKPPARPTPEPAPEAAAQSTPEPIPEAAAQPTPEPAPEAAAQPTPEPVPEAAAQPTPEPAPEAAAQPNPTPTSEPEKPAPGPDSADRDEPRPPGVDTPS